MFFFFLGGTTGNISCDGSFKKLDKIFKFFCLFRKSQRFVFY